MATSKSSLNKLPKTLLVSTLATLIQTLLEEVEKPKEKSPKGTRSSKSSLQKST
jgi:hypothetical protein